MTAHELARLLLAGPDVTVLMSTELGPAAIAEVEVDADTEEAIGATVYLIEDQS